MYIIPIAWLYVALMMSVAEATNSNGTVFGAIVTFVFYGLLPIGLILYFMAAPARKRAIRAREALEQQTAVAPTPALQVEPTQTVSLQPDAGSLAPADAVAPVGKEP